MYPHINLLVFIAIYLFLDINLVLTQFIGNDFYFVCSGKTCSIWEDF